MRQGVYFTNKIILVVSKKFMKIFNNHIAIAKCYNVFIKNIFPTKFQNNNYIYFKYNMNSSQKSVKSRSSSSKSKKGGNFLGSVSELFVPTGWESFATAAGLLAIDRVDAALRRKSEKSSVKKMSGGSETDVHQKVLHILQTDQYLTNAFIKLYNHAYSLDETEARDLRLTLNNLINKEIDYRTKIYLSSGREDFKPLIAKSIKKLDELQRYGNGDYQKFQKYFIPNINKTLSNISGIYSNKNKYSN